LAPETMTLADVEATLAASSMELGSRLAADPAGRNGSGPRAGA
jgi:hypothetical protein